jgi:hypothetical protein
LGDGTKYFAGVVAYRLTPSKALSVRCETGSRFEDVPAGRHKKKPKRLSLGVVLDFALVAGTRMGGDKGLIGSG